MDDIREAFENGEYTDVVVICGGGTWHAHRVVLLKKSSYFKSLFNEENNEIQLTDDDADTVEAAIHHCYYQTYPCKKETPISAARFHAAMVLFVSKIKVNGLLPQAKDNFRKSVSSLRKDKSLADLITDNLSNEKRGRADLQECFVEVLKPHADEIISASTSYIEVQEAVQAVPSLYIALARAATDSRRPGTPASRSRSRSPARSGHGDAGSYQYLATGEMESLYVEHEYRCPSCRSVFYKVLAEDEVYMHPCREDKREPGMPNEFNAKDWKDMCRRNAAAERVV